MSTYKTVNPATGETLQEFPTLDDEGVETALARAQAGFETWRATAPADRAAVLSRVAGLYDERADELARLVSLEMGKPVREAKGEVKLSSMIYQYYADQGPALLEDQTLDVPGADETVVRTLPVGALVGVMPWNFPYYQVARFAAPNLMLGNTVLLKHAPNCPQSALLMEEIFVAAGLPADAYVNIFATNEQVADMIADPRVHGVSLTGSERAGAAVAEVAGRNLKKVVLELGGSDAFIVLDSADMDATVKSATRGRMSNTGQACNAAKRFIVLEPYYDEFVAKLTASFEAMTPGDPSDPRTAIGPLSSQTAADTLTGQVDTAVSEGATLLTGGHRIDGPGAFVEPTLLADVTPSMRAFSEELFGPVGVVYKVATPEEAVALTNSSPFGLSGSVWSADVDKAREVADELEVGMAFVNEHGTTLPAHALRRGQAVRLRPRARPLGHGRVREQEAGARHPALSRGGPPWGALSSACCGCGHRPTMKRWTCTPSGTSWCSSSSSGPRSWAGRAWAGCGAGPHRSWDGWARHAIPSSPRVDPSSRSRSTPSGSASGSTTPLPASRTPASKAGARPTTWCWPRRAARWRSITCSRCWSRARSSTWSGCGSRSLSTARGWRSSTWADGTPH